MLVLLTRPQAESESLSHALVQKGIQAAILPALEIVKLPIEQVLKTIPDEINPAVAIFTSQHAVIAKDCLPFISCVIAIGHKTADALMSAGYENVLLPDKYTSEGVLDMLALQSVSQKQIWLFSGEGGRTLISDTLAARGASVHAIKVYRRICPKFVKPESLTMIKTQRIAIVLLTSEESLQNLQKILGSHIDLLYHNSEWLVISERLAQILMSKGCKQTIKICEPDEKAIIRTLTQW